MIVVTGASGQFGRLAVENLLQRGVPAANIAVAVRTPAKVSDLAARGVAVREADYDRPETLTAAFAGADKLLFVSTTGPDDLRIAQHRAVVNAATAARVGLVVYTSIAQADINPIGLARVHRDTEAALADSGLPNALLRNNWYTENYTGGLADAVARGAIVGALGDGRIASATRADYAEAAAVVLTSDQPQAGRVYELTGDSTWSMPELAAEASDRAGKPVIYTDLPAEQYAAILAGAGLPGFVVDLLVDVDVSISHGALARVTGDLAALLDRPTTPLGDAVAQALKN
jgi:NAD(P)H dehydrogenase (quinone)